MISSYRPSRLVIEGWRRRGINLRLEDAISKFGRVENATVLDFSLSADIPLLPGIPPPVEFISKTPPESIKILWCEQLRCLSSLIEECAPSEVIWGAVRPEEIAAAGGGLKADASLQLIRKFDLGGSEWVGQFTFGFPLIGALSRGGICPSDENVRPAPQLSGIWPGTIDRFT